MKETLSLLKPKLLGDKLLSGWQEWCILPKLGLPLIKAKIDTGAKTSALHAFDIEEVHYRGKRYVHFWIHPLQRNADIAVSCKALVVEKRWVMSSNGHKENRYVIRTPLMLGRQIWNIDITLSNRDPLAFRMLLGREALDQRVMIDPSRALCQGNVTRSWQRRLYEQKDAATMLKEAIKEIAKIKD